MQEIQSRLGISIPRVLLPTEDIDLYKWAVIACDQFTSEPAYWEKAADIVGGAPSTLSMIYPEIWLGKEDPLPRVAAIAQAMERYLEEGVLRELAPGVIVTRRENAEGTLARTGIMLAVDLECYDYHKGAQTLIRTTEGTIEERIPPRLKVRERAALEVPHVMMLIDDEGHSVIEPLCARAADTAPLYDTELMLDGGRVCAWHVGEGDAVAGMLRALDALYARSAGRTDGAPVLFAVGDGNHSLAAAKAHWENVKQGLDPAAAKAHPARFTLCEVVNLYDAGIRFEPIHRLLFGVDADKALAFLKEYYDGAGMGADILEENAAAAPGGHAFGFRAENKAGTLLVRAPVSPVAAETLQSGLDALHGFFPDARIDYIHGSRALNELSAAPGCLGFMLPQMDKHLLFETVARGDVLPRKAFSIGEANEKRYYMECRRIRP